MQSGIYEGTVRHRRFEPVAHQFRTSLFLMYLDLNEISTVFRGRWFWSVERWNLATFRRRDHLGDPGKPLDETIRNLVESETGRRPAGPIRLLTHLSYLGYCFNPLSIFFCFDETGQRLDSIVAEVTNTPWKERHCYVLSVAEGPNSKIHSTVVASAETPSKYAFQFAKNFHVSPFMTMNFEYRWSMSGPGPHLVLHAENWQNNHSCFDATLNLKRREINSWTLAHVLLRYPLMTVQVIASIYWQALRLWWKKIPYIPHPHACPTQETDKNPHTDLPVQETAGN